MSQRVTKRIDGVVGATVGNDWITLNFGSHTITIDNLKIYNGPKENAVAELTKEREANVGTIKLRPAVQWFAEQMELALQENDHKTGWKDCHKDFLIEQLYRNSSKIWKNEQIPHYAVNVANYAMMLADNARSILEGNEPNEGV